MSNNNHWWQKSGLGISVQELEEQLRLERINNETDIERDVDDEIFEGQPPEILPEDDYLLDRNALWL